MSDEQKATLSLTLVNESCTAALAALSEDVNPDGDSTRADFSTLRTDFLSLLAILYSATTKVALSLKPSSPQPKASLIPLKDLSNNVAALVHSIRLMRFHEGSTVLAEYEKIARNVITAIRSLTQTLMEKDSSEQYLVRTGEVHELIENARKPGGLALNNCDAARRLWQQGHDSLTDAYDEIQEICKPAQGDGLDEQEGDFDGWEELGMSPNQKLSLAEQDRAEKLQSMVKLLVLLHKRVLKNTLSVDAVKRDNSMLDKLAPLSGLLLAASDDLISSMYAPQELSNVKIFLDAFWDTTKGIRLTIMQPSVDDPLSVSADDKTMKWFFTCFDQLDKIHGKMLDTLMDKHEPSA